MMPLNTELYFAKSSSDTQKSGNQNSNSIEPENKLQTPEPPAQTSPRKLPLPYSHSAQVFLPIPMVAHDVRS